MKKFLAVILAMMCLTGCTTESVYIPEDFEFYTGQVAFVFPELMDSSCGIIESTNGQCILVGTGGSNDFPELYKKLRNRDIEKISAIILNEDNEGCIAALGKILSNFAVERVYVSDEIKNIDTYRQLCRYNAENCEFYIASEGTRINDENGLIIDVVSSAVCGDEVSLSLYTLFGETGVFFADTPDEKNAKDIINTFGKNLVSDVFVICNKELYINKELLQLTCADYAVKPICAQNDNDTQFVQIIKEAGANLKSASANGAITFVSDGKIIKCHTER